MVMVRVRVEHLVDALLEGLEHRVAGLALELRRLRALDKRLDLLLTRLDGADDVFRYAWFTARNVVNQMNGGSNLLPANSTDMGLTSTGVIYATI